MEWSREAWAEKLQEVPPRILEPDDWPKGIRPITLDERGLGVDRKGTLYWQLKPVAMRVKLRWFELTLAILATVATVVQAITSVLTLLNPPMH
jgi:hypothetical protein